jgi:prephenate dehydrogenase
MTEPSLPIPPALATATVAVVGLGLMGGSLAAALRGGGDDRQCARVVGVVRQTASGAAAERAGIVDSATTNLAAGVAAADIVVLALPVRAILDTLSRLGPLLKPGALVLDLGSSKAQICAALGTLPSHVTAVGGHPMCGKDRGGLDHADPALYQGAPFVLVPTTRTTPAALAQAEALARAIGARPRIVDAARHDAATAAISHVPYLLAVAGVMAAAEQAATDGLAWELAAGGFRDTTRVAASEVPVMRDTLLTNRAAVGAHLARVQQALATVQELVERGDEAGLTTYLERAQHIRRSLFV